MGRLECGLSILPCSSALKALQTTAAAAKVKTRWKFFAEGVDVHLFTWRAASETKMHTLLVCVSPIPFFVSRPSQAKSP